MEIYVRENGITLTGKAWEIRQKLKEYGHEYKLVKDWLYAVSKPGRRSV